jgi:hypothetical protein
MVVTRRQRQAAEAAEAAEAPDESEGDASEAEETSVGEVAGRTCGGGRRSLHDNFIEIGAEIMRPPSLLSKNKQTTTESFESRWTSHFNAEVEVCIDVWDRLREDGHEHMAEAEPCHLLWALLFLQVYAVEVVLAGMCECNEETFRKYADRTLVMISFLEFDVVRPLLAPCFYYLLAFL